MQRRSAALCDASSHVFPLAPSPSRSVTSGDPTGTGKYVWLFVESSRLIIFRKNHSWKNLFRHFYPFQFYLMEETTQYDEIRTHIDERVLLKKKSAKIFTSFNKWLVIQVKKNLSGNPTGGDDVYGFQMNAQRFHAITNTPSGRGLTGDTGRWFNNERKKKRGTWTSTCQWNSDLKGVHSRTIALLPRKTTQHCGLSPISGTKRVCSTAYIHKRACPTTDTRLPSLKDSTDANAEGPMGPGRSIPLTVACQGQT